MTKQEILTKILTNRINNMKENNNTDFTGIQDTLNVFLAGDSITLEQYTILKEIIAKNN